MKINMTPKEKELAVIESILDIVDTPVEQRPLYPYALSPDQFSKLSPYIRWLTTMEVIGVTLINAGDVEKIITKLWKIQIINILNPEEEIRIFEFTIEDIVKHRSKLINGTNERIKEKSDGSTNVKEDEKIEYDKGAWKLYYRGKILHDLNASTTLEVFKTVFNEKIPIYKYQHCKTGGERRLLSEHLRGFRTRLRNKLIKAKAPTALIKDILVSVNGGEVVISERIVLKNKR